MNEPLIEKQVFSETSNVKNTGISAQYALTQRNAATAAATTPQRNARAFHPRYASDAQPVKAENIHHGQQNAR